ncbi:MAG: AAA family ATPase [Bacteroidales bacterium]|nr:AAA family ATPase [Bacteroidales bacterium]
MEELDLRILYDFYYQKLSSVNSKFHRYLYHEINWDSRLIAIKGARGVGKTTMLIQRIQENFPDKSKALYAALDNMWFSNHTLYQLAMYAQTRGITHLFLDEVHRYPNWAQEIKMINDSLTDVKVVYTCSAMLEIEKSKVDFSRRQTLYHLRGMSFREFLELEGVTNAGPFTLEEIVTNHVNLALETIRGIKILPLFERFLKAGFYPFYKDAGKDYLTRLAEVVQTVIDIDLPAIMEVSYATQQKAKRLLMYLANNPPIKPEMRALCSSLESTRDQVLLLANILDRADLLMLFSSKERNYKNLIIPEKMFLNNPNLMFALAEKADIGTVRESFMLNQTEAKHKVEMPKQGDILVDHKYLFEVGGSNKTFDQIANIPDSYLAIDDTEVGYGNKIPLWLFGLMY